MLKIENRASVVLYRFLKSNFNGGIFILPANVCPIVPLTFLKAGVDFIFIDICDSHSINKGQCLDIISKNKIDGLLFVHAYGKVFDNDLFYKDVKSINPGITIIDDKCLCIPDLSIDVNENIDLELFSTGYAKYIELGYGGWGKICNGFKYNEVELQYEDDNYEFQMEAVKKSLTTNSNFFYKNQDWLNTAPLEIITEDYFEIIRSKLLEVYTHKREINKIYNDQIPDNVKFGVGYSDWRYMIHIDNRNRLLEDVKRNNLFVGTNFPSVAKIFKGKDMPIADTFEKTTINLFNDFRVSKLDAFKICEIITKNSI